MGSYAKTHRHTKKGWSLERRMGNRISQEQKKTCKEVVLNGLQ